MLSRAQIDAYRRMSVAERLRLTFELTEFADAALASLPAGERERRLRILREEHARSNEEILRRLEQALRGSS